MLDRGRSYDLIEFILHFCSVHELESAGMYMV
jgi:hypothetical protein